MFCPNCGTNLPDNNPVATQPMTTNTQTNSVSEKNTARSKKKGFLGILITAVAVSGIFLCLIYFTNLFSSAKHYEGSGYSSPEAASKAYVEALSNEDYDKMLSTFAIESFVKNFDQVAYLDRLKAYIPAMKYQFMYTDDFSEDMLIQTRIGEIQGVMNYQYMTYSGIAKNLNDMGYDRAESILLNDENGAQIFVNEIFKNTKSPSSLHIKYNGLVDPSKLGLSEDILEKAEKNMEAFQLTYGAEDMKDIILSLTIGGEEYYLFTECVKYDGKWYIQTLGGTCSYIFGLDINLAGLVRVADTNNSNDSE